MKIIETDFEGLIIVDYTVHGDERGFFMELHNQKSFQDQGLDLSFKQDNLSRSSYGTLRGMHFQEKPYAQGKLVTVLQGEVFDAVIDFRQDQPTYGQWFGITLNDQKRQALYVPEGFAHGFCVLSETADFFYKCTQVYHPEAQKTILWNDPQVGIEWPIEPNLGKISEKDKAV